MDAEGKFWSTAFTIAGVTLVCIVASMSGCTAYQTNAVVQMVRAGADPIRAQCGVFPGRQPEQCAILASKGN